MLESSMYSTSCSKEHANTLYRYDAINNFNDAKSQTKVNNQVSKNKDFY